MDAVERTSLVINDRLKSPLICEFKDGHILVSCTTPLGSASDRIAADLQGNGEKMGFNSRFLLDCPEKLRNRRGTHRTGRAAVPHEGAAGHRRILSLPGAAREAEEMSREVIAIDTEFIRLDALLKLAGAVPTGGQAKVIIQSGRVQVNGDLAAAGEKMRPGDVAACRDLDRRSKCPHESRPTGIRGLPQSEGRGIPALRGRQYCLRR